MPAPALLLWLDVESSGLLDDPTPPTFLEAAWVITDTAGEQRTPLSQVFTALPARQFLQELQEIVTPSPEDSDDYDNRATWWPAPYSYPATVVREMHAANGLAQEWYDFSQGPDQHRIIRGWVELERMLLDALDMAGWRGLDRRQVILAGGGVGHHEDRFLRTFCPRVFGDPRVHYAVADVSTVLRTLRTRALVTPGEDEDGGFPGTADRLIERYRPDMREPHDAALDTSWADIRLDPRRYDAADRCGWSRGVDADGAAWEAVTEHWAVMERDNHRAAPGIARALMAYRLLPRLLADAVVPLPAQV